MQIKSINFIKESDLPPSQRNTELTATADAIVEKLKTAPAGQALIVQLDNSSKYTRYALQRAIQKRGGAALVRSGKGKHEFAVLRVAAPAKK